jgi:tellurite resistance protein TerA
MPKKKTSIDSMREASRSRVNFSGHGRALGAAGQRHRVHDPENSDFLREHGQSIAISPGAGGFGSITIGAEWDNIVVEQGGFFNRLFKKTMRKGVDLDLGCLYEIRCG